MVVMVEVVVRRVVGSPVGHRGVEAWHRRIPSTLAIRDATATSTSKLVRWSYKVCERRGGHRRSEHCRLLACERTWWRTMEAKLGRSCSE